MHYERVTDGIKVSVEPSYSDDRSAPDEHYFFWTYTVEIENLGEERVQLRSRFWRITDGLGQVQEVSGAGVVGEQPVLEPGESFRYTSGAPLKTPSGIMMGSYKMALESGELFDVEIPAFSLDVPDFDQPLN